MRLRTRFPTRASGSLRRVGSRRQNRPLCESGEEKSKKAAAAQDPRNLCHMRRHQRPAIQSPNRPCESPAKKFRKKQIDMSPGGVYSMSVATHNQAARLSIPFGFLGFPQGVSAGPLLFSQGGPASADLNSTTRRRRLATKGTTDFQSAAGVSAMPRCFQAWIRKPAANSSMNNERNWPLVKDPTSAASGSR